MPKNGHTILKTKLNEYFVDGFECYQTSDKKDFFTSKYDAIKYFFEYGDGMVYFQHVRDINQTIVAFRKEKNDNLVYPFCCGNEEYKVRESVVDDVCKIIIDAVPLGCDFDLIIEAVSKVNLVDQKYPDYLKI